MTNLIYTRVSSFPQARRTLRCSPLILQEAGKDLLMQAYTKVFGPPSKQEFISSEKTHSDGGEGFQQPGTVPGRVGNMEGAEEGVQQEPHRTQRYLAEGAGSWCGILVWDLYLLVQEADLMVWELDLMMWDLDLLVRDLLARGLCHPMHNLTQKPPP